MMEILRILNSDGDILGAKSISEQLNKRGYFIGERAVRYHMRMLDEKGFTEKIGHKGRRITQKGVDELKVGLIYDQVDFIYSKFQEKMYNVSLDLNNAKGTVIVNISSVNDSESENVIKTIFEKGLAVSKNVLWKKKDDTHYIETVCGTTIDAVFQKNGIISKPSYGGLIQIEDYTPLKFIEQIAYEKTSITPLEAFTGSDMTSVLDVVTSGTGVVPANFRLIPAVKREHALKLIEQLNNIGIGGILKVGHDGENILGINVPRGYVAIAVIGGVTPLCAAQEEGYDLNIKLADSHAEYWGMISYDYANNSIIKQDDVPKNNSRVSFILNKMINLISQVDYDYNTSKGKVIANISYIDNKYVDEAVDLLDDFYDTKPELCTGDKYTLVDLPDSSAVGIATVCSLTVNGILTNEGIHVEPKYSGVLEMHNNQRRFIELISYTGSSMDPHEIFIKKNIHDVRSTVDGHGKILAGVHMIPYVARDECVEIFDSLSRQGFRIFDVGKPNEYLYNAKIDKYNFGYVTTGGLNPIVMLKENGIPLEIKSIESIMDYSLFD